jgi:hypothetical protein
VSGVSELTVSRGHGSRCGTPASLRHDGYARRRPEETVLYQTIAEHWPRFVEKMEEHGGLPRFVREEFQSYLKCGRLEEGYAVTD